MKKIFFAIFNYSLLIFNSTVAFAQIKWTNVDSLYQPLPQSVHIYLTNEKIDSGNFRAYYIEADLKDKKLEFTVDTALNRRVTPKNFYEKSGHPLVISNCSFFSFQTNRNVNVLIKEGKMISYDTQFVKGKGKDSLLHFFTLRSAIGINKKRDADIVWTAEDSSMKFPAAFESPEKPLALKENFTRSRNYLEDSDIQEYLKKNAGKRISKWKMETAIGGGPVLVQNGEVNISNNEEMMFAGKALYDKHPRTAIGYTQSGKLILLVIEGRSPNATGSNLIEEAKILKDIGCWEAMNLDGGGSSYMMVNGKPTIKPSDISGQRAVPAVFMIRMK
jgi:hypothetical protein